MYPCQVQTALVSMCSRLPPQMMQSSQLSMALQAFLECRSSMQCSSRIPQPELGGGNLSHCRVSQTILHRGELPNSRVSQTIFGGREL